MGKKPKSKTKSKAKGRGTGRILPRSSNGHYQDVLTSPGEVAASSTRRRTLKERITFTGILSAVWGWLMDVYDVLTDVCMEICRGCCGRRGRGGRRKSRLIAPHDDDDDDDAAAEETSLDERELRDMLKHVAVLSLDCEMVGAGPRGWESLLARCSIIRYDAERDAKRRRRQRQQQVAAARRQHDYAHIAGAKAEKKMVGYRVVYDTLVRPTKPVTDYRTPYSGITKKMLEGHSSLPVVSYSQCRRDVAAILKTGRLPLGEEEEEDDDDDQDKEDNDKEKETLQQNSENKKEKDEKVASTNEDDKEEMEAKKEKERQKEEENANKPTTKSTTDASTKEEDIRAVLLVGHALKNDFEALDLKHPASLVRDTSLYPPFTRGGGRDHGGPGRRRRRPRKLRDLAYEELDGAVIQASTQMGHSSVEDSAAALSLYWKYWRQWERRLRYPLRKYYRPSDHDAKSGAAVVAAAANKKAANWQPLCLYLDGSNLPLGLRRVDNDEEAEDEKEAEKDGPKFKWQLLSKTSIGATQRHGARRSTTTTTTSPGVVRTKKSQYTKGRKSGGGTSGKSSSLSSSRSFRTRDAYRNDWVPTFAAALESSSSWRPKFASITIVFDGSKYSQVEPSRRPTSTNLGMPGLELIVTPPGVESDTVLVQYCRRNAQDAATTTESFVATASVSRVRELLSKPIVEEEEEDAGDKGGQKEEEEEEEEMFPRDDQEDEQKDWFASPPPRPEKDDVLPHWIVVRRKSGGKKSSASTLLKKLLLNRPTEGAHCLSGLSAALRRQGAGTADEFLYHSMASLVECHVHARGSLRSVVVTDDVLLAHRIVGEEKNAMVLSFAQFQQLF